ncbi:MAG: hypothetical protein WC277_08035 [Bacilli bacterium]|jgi:TolA-binding protein
MITSISIPEDLQPYVKPILEKRGFSDLVCRLLRVYFDSSMAEPAIAGVLESDLQNQLETLQESVVQIQDRIGSLSAQKVEAKQNQEKQVSEVSTLIEQQYDDRTDLRQWVRACGGPDRFKRAMKTRLSIVATKAGVSAEVAKAAIIEKYPELEAYL